MLAACLHMDVPVCTMFCTIGVCNKASDDRQPSGSRQAKATTKSKTRDRSRGLAADWLRYTKCAQPQRNAECNKQNNQKKTTNVFYPQPQRLQSSSPMKFKTFLAC